MTTWNWGVMVSVAISLATLGCGSSSIGGATTACTTNSGSATDKGCLETYTSLGIAGGTAQAKADCNSEGGVASDSCSHVGADGGCRISDSSSGITLSITTWFYAGAASTEMANCMSDGNVWIAP